MNNKELAEEIWRWHDVLFGTEFRFSSDIEDFLNEKVKVNDHSWYKTRDNKTFRNYKKM